MLSLDDLLSWDRVVHARRLLSDAAWAEALTPVRLTSGEAAPYGLGWEIGVRGGSPMYYHSGEWKGFKSHYAHFSGHDVSVIILMNGVHGNSTRFRDAVAEAFDERLARPASLK